MRQFVFGIVIAGFLWWAFGGDVFGRMAGTDASAPVPAPAEGAPAAGSSAASHRGSVSEPGPVPEQAAVHLRDLMPGAASTREAVPMPPSPEDFETMLTAIGKRDSAALDRGWALLAGPVLGQMAVTGVVRQRLAAACTTPAANDVASLLAQLGSGNSFLHSEEGRGFGAKLLGALAALGDADAIGPGSRLLELATRGRIEKQDQDAALFVDRAYQQHRGPVDRWLCNPDNVQGARSYIVQRGDALAKIAGRCRKDGILVDDGTLQILNRIPNPDRIRPDQHLKAPLDPILTVVEKRSFTLCVYVGDLLLRLYWVGHGAGDKTPLAEFTVGNKQPKPQWTSPDGNVYPYGDPRNILGEYFVSLQHAGHQGFGVHGTPEPDTIRTMSSMGCVRMLAPDIAEFFRLVPRGTKLVVRASTPQA
ncbi:MAG: L,D-transpeptidase family protein [Planctomycetes bacterium]|nr:L,D-transpeptidase family protein [Planctomycetota bacterium]